jgi:cell division protein FtsL
VKSLVIIIIIDTISKIEKLIIEQHLKNSVIVAISILSPYIIYFNLQNKNTSIKEAS